jgi:hypothetical protein
MTGGPPGDVSCEITPYFTVDAEVSVDEHSTGCVSNGSGTGGQKASPHFFSPAFSLRARNGSTVPYAPEKPAAFGVGRGLPRIFD